MTASPSTDITLFFSQTLDPTSAGKVAVHSARTQGLCPGTATITGAQLMWQPAFDFLPGEKVSVIIPASMVVSNGTALLPHVHSFTVAASSATGYFSSGSEVLVGNDPGSVAVTDIDNDGDVDLLSANISSNSVSVRLNDGTGAFSGGVELAVGQQPFWITTADVDNDSDLDLLTADYGTNGVSVCRNNGRGAFGPTTRFGVGGYPRELVTADLDGDGDIDFATANSDVDNSLSIGYNDGTGTFNTASLPVQVGRRPYSLAAADGDSDIDLLSSNHDDHIVSVRLNDGKGHFSGGSEVARRLPASYS